MGKIIEMEHLDLNECEGEVVPELFPLKKRGFKDKYFMFKITKNKKCLLLSSRFKTAESAERNLKKFLNGEFEACFGNCSRRMMLKERDVR